MRHICGSHPLDTLCEVLGSTVQHSGVLLKQCSSSSAVPLRHREELTCLWGRLVYTVVPGLERNTNAFCYLAENPMALET